MSRKWGSSLPKIWFPSFHLQVQTIFLIKVWLATYLIEPRLREQSKIPARFLQTRFSILTGCAQYKTVEKLQKNCNDLGCEHPDVYLSVPPIAVWLRKWLGRFWRSTSSGLPARVSSRAEYKYSKERSIIQNIYAVQTSACMEKRFNYSLQMTLHDFHMQRTACTYSFIVSWSTLFLMTLCFCERSFDMFDRTYTSFLQTTQNMHFFVDSMQRNCIFPSTFQSAV